MGECPYVPPPPVPAFLEPVVSSTSTTAAAATAESFPATASASAADNDNDDTSRAEYFAAVRGLFGPEAGPVPDDDDARRRKRRTRSRAKERAASAAAAGNVGGESGGANGHGENGGGENGGGKNGHGENGGGGNGRGENGGDQNVRGEVTEGRGAGGVQEEKGGPGVGGDGGDGGAEVGRTSATEASTAAAAALAVAATAADAAAVAPKEQAGKANGHRSPENTKVNEEKGECKKRRWETPEEARERLRLRLKMAWRAVDVATAGAAVTDTIMAKAGPSRSEGWVAAANKSWRSSGVLALHGKALRPDDAEEGGRPGVTWWVPLFSFVLPCRRCCRRLSLGVFEVLDRHLAASSFGSFPGRFVGILWGGMLQTMRIVVYFAWSVVRPHSDGLDV